MSPRSNVTIDEMHRLPKSYTVYYKVYKRLAHYNME